MLKNLLWQLGWGGGSNRDGHVWLGKRTPDGHIGLGECTPVSVFVRQAGGVPDSFISIESTLLPFMIGDAVRFSIGYVQLAPLWF